MSNTLLLEQVEREIELLGTEEVPDRVLSVMYRLSKFGEPAVEPLLNVLQDERRSSNLRQRVIGMFPEFIEDARVIQPIIDLLRNDDVKIRWAAVKALENLRAEAAIAELERVAANDEGEFYPMPKFRISVKEDAAKAMKQILSGTEPQYKRIQKLKAGFRRRLTSLERERPIM